tara:strand:+ start:356 stop:565 length:210 start_codon:yes stop_codon:yes gene_type:complete
LYATDGSSGDTILGLASAENINIIRNYREIQQDLTELNGDGNRERGHYGEDESKEDKEAKEEVELDQGC